jgi:AcrR family transcriptional regulator
MSTETITVQGVNPPKTKLGLAKMHKIIDAAEELFTKVGFYQTSIADICKKAETAVGTFYIYFDTKTDIYRYLMEKYKQDIKTLLEKSIEGCTTRYDKEREGIKCFIKYAVKNPNVYNIILGSLSIDKNMFVDYYVSFSRSYTSSLSLDISEVNTEDPTTVAYALMGASNFLGLKAIFENMSEEEIDNMIDNTLMPALVNGIFKNM